MKKYCYLITSIVCITLLFLSCEKSSIEKEELRVNPASKVDVCQYDKELDEFKHINISENALQKHLDNHNEGESMQDYVIDLAEDDSDGDGIADCADCDSEDASMGAKNIWYLDDDGDGYGDTDTYIETCMTLEEANAHFAENEDPNNQNVFVDDNTDCDDNDDTVYLGADEICDDNLDNDCDGEIDEDCDDD